MAAKQSTVPKVAHGSTGITILLVLLVTAMKMLLLTNRSMGAGLRLNMGPAWSPTVWYNMSNKEPSQAFRSHAEETLKCVTAERRRKATDEAKEQCRQREYVKTGITEIKIQFSVFVVTTVVQSLPFYY